MIHFGDFQMDCRTMSSETQPKDRSGLHSKLEEIDVAVSPYICRITHYSGSYPYNLMSEPSLPAAAMWRRTRSEQILDQSKNFSHQHLLVSDTHTHSAESHNSYSLWMPYLHRQRDENSRLFRGTDKRLKTPKEKGRHVLCHSET